VPDRLNEAMEEAYASAPRSVVLVDVVELDHASFASPIYLATGIEDDFSITLEDGVTEIDFVADPELASTAKIVGFHMIPPGFMSDGPTPAKLIMENVSRILYPHLKDAQSSNLPINVVYRSYRSDQLTAPGEVIEGLRLRNVMLGAVQVEGELSFEETSTQAFPRRTYTLDDYPGTWNA
jgi:hypothetical protein